MPPEIPPGACREGAARPVLRWLRAAALDFARLVLAAAVLVFALAFGLVAFPLLRLVDAARRWRLFGLDFAALRFVALPISATPLLTFAWSFTQVESPVPGPSTRFKAWARSRSLWRFRWRWRSR